MKIIELTKKFNIAITNEEAELLDKFDEDTPVMAKTDLTEREQLTANHLVNKNLLIRKNQNGQITYKRTIR